MTLDQLTQRDRRIAALEAIGTRARTAAEQDELGRLLLAREAYWRRLPEQLALARRKVREVESYAAQIGFTFLLENAHV